MRVGKGGGGTRAHILYGCWKHKRDQGHHANAQ